MVDVPMEKFEKERIHRFEMAYVAESYYGDTLTFCIEEETPGIYNVEVKKNEGETVCRSRVEFVAR